MMEDPKNMPSMAEPSDQPDLDSTVDQVAGRRVGILVLGMHRSGSSAITRMLSLLGCTLPQTLMGAHPSNPTGHWESDAVANFNDEILTLAGTDWRDWMPVNARLSETLIWPQLVARGRDVLRGEFADAPLFVLKDPRICKLTGFWLEVLAAEGIDAAFVLPLRNPIEVARSLATRDGIEEYQGLLIWLRHVLAAEAASRGLQRVFTDYAALLDNWEDLSARLSAGLGLVWPRISTLSSAEIAQFLTPELRHHVSNSAELGNNPAITPWVRKAYEVLLDWARHGEKPADYAVLDQISQEFDNAGTAFARPLLNAARAVEMAAQADTARAAIVEERDAVARRLGEVEAELAQSHGERDARIAERDELANERSAVAVRLGEVEAELAQARVERNGVAAERDALAAQSASLADDRSKVAWRLGEVEAELEWIRGERNALDAQRAKLANDNATLADDREKVARRLSEVEAELEWIRGERNALDAERTRLASDHAMFAEERARGAWRLGEVEHQLAESRADKEQVDAHANSLGDDLDTARAEVDTLNYRLAVTESTLRQREEEIAQLGTELEFVEKASLGRLADVVKLTELLRDGEAAEQLRAAQADSERLAFQTELHVARQAFSQSEQRQKESSAELVMLTRELQAYEKTLVSERKRTDWLRSGFLAVTRLPWWWHFLPPRMRRKREVDRLRQRDLFDAAVYVARYPDVGASGMDALRHYVRHGMEEGRKR